MRSRNGKPGKPWRSDAVAPTQGGQRSGNCPARRGWGPSRGRPSVPDHGPQCSAQNSVRARLASQFIQANIWFSESQQPELKTKTADEDCSRLCPCSRGGVTGRTLRGFFCKQEASIHKPLPSEDCPATLSETTTPPQSLFSFPGPAFHRISELAGPLKGAVSNCCPDVTAF